MTRTLNIDKMKLDAARAIRDTMSEQGIGGFEAYHRGIDPNDLDNIRANQIKNIPLEKLHAILGRLTPDSS